MAEHFNGAAAWAERKKERAASFDGAAAWAERREQRRAALAAAPQPLTTRETERADELDKLTRPSARRTERADEADKQTPPRRTLKTPTGSALVRNTDSGALQQRMVQQLEAAAKDGLFQRTLPEERGSRHRSRKELSQKILHDTETAERIRNAAAGTAQGAAANAAGFLGALVAAAEKIDKQYRDEKERLGAATHADEMNPYPKTNEEVTRGNRAGVQLLEGIADTQRAKAQANTARAKEGASALGSIGIDALQIGLNLAAIVGANAVAPGAGLALMGTQSGGAAANDYRKYAAANGQEANPYAAAGLALGGLASAGAGSAAAKGALKYGGALVNRLGLGSSKIVQYALGALGDMAFSGGMSAGNEYAKAAAYGDSYDEVRISGEDLAKDMLFQAAVGFLCRTLTSSFGGNTSSAGQPERVQREYFKGIDNLDDLAKAFKQYGRKFHPDRFATASAATQRQMSDIFARISAEYNAVKAELAIETAGRAAKSYSEKRSAGTPEAAEQAGRAVENELMILKRAVENGTLAGAEAAEAVQIMEAAQGSTADSPAAGAEDALQALKSSPAQDAGYSRQRAGGPVAPSGVSATQESKTSIAPAAAEDKGEILSGGKRVNLGRYANERNAQEISRGLNDGTLAVDADNRLYRVNEGEHIDRRNSVTVGQRSMNAFQFDHPELHQYFRDAAADLAEELSYAEKGGEIIRRTIREAGDDEYFRTKRVASERIARLLDDERIGYDDIDRAVTALIHDEGQENFAAAKRVELMLDNMLTSGYTDIHGCYVAPNEHYIAAKQAIRGADTSVQTHEELPLWDLPETQNGGIYGRQKENAGGLEPAEGGGQRADAVAAAGDLYRGDRGRGSAEYGSRGAEELRSRAEKERRNQQVAKQRRAEAAMQPLTSSAALGVSGGTDKALVHVLPEERWDDELRSVADFTQKNGVRRVTMVTGLLEVDTGAGVENVSGYIDREKGEMVLRVDSTRGTATELARHEIGHAITQERNVRAFMQEVQAGGDSRQEIYRAYERRYAALTRNYIGMTPEELTLYVWEEILEDAYAGLDSYGHEASRYHDAAVRAIEERQAAGTPARGESESLQLRAVDEPKSRGPPERFGIRRTQDIPYQEQIDAFYGGDSKTVGRSDDIYIADADNSLSALGIGEKPFFMLKSNLRKSTRIAGNNPSNSAHGISESVIRKLPELIKSPALIVRGNGRISIIPGIAVKTEKNNTAPLLIAVNPNSSVDGIDAYEIKSIYGRENFANWLDLRAKDSKIIAGDEKKAAALLRDVGKQYPEPVAYAADLTDAILSQGKSDVKFPTLGEEIRRQIQGDETAAPSREDRGRTGPPVRYSYAGKSAKSADLAALDDAQHYEMQGVDAETIRQKTGWFRGMDGKWRFEIDDSDMTYHRGGDAAFSRDHPDYAEHQKLMRKWMTGDVTAEEKTRLQQLDETWGREYGRLSERVDRGNATLEDILDHKALFRAYPQLRRTKVEFTDPPKNTMGSYSPSQNLITLSNELRGAPQETLVHEIQHAIQNAEGFARGSNREYWEERLTSGDEIQSKGFQDAREKLIRFQLDEANEEALALKDKIERAGELDDDLAEYDRLWEEAERRGLDGKINEYYDLRDNYYTQMNRPGNSVPSELYYNTAGEIEARDAANRRSMSDWTRKMAPPDYGDENTVFAEDGDGYAMSRSEQDSVKEQLREHQSELNNMKAVATIRDNGWKGMSTGAFRQKVVNDLKKTGYHVDNPSIGEIDFDEKLLNRSLNYIQTDAEAAAYQALPQVLKRGIEISGHGNHKGRDYETLTIAAPVELNGKRGNMAVVVMRTKGNRYKVHRILTPDGKAFALPEMANAVSTSVGGITEGAKSSGEVTPAINTAPMRSISKNSENVKPLTFWEDVRRQIMGEEKKANAEPNTVGAFANDSQSSGGSAPAIDTAHDGSIADKRGNVRYSLDEQRAEDEAYLSLAEDPKRNRGKLQEMVNAAAERAGYDSPDLYHGTRAFGFTEFDLAKMDDGTSIFLTTNPTVAGTYTSADAENTNLETLYRNPKSPADRGNPLKRVDAKSAPLGEVIAAWNREADALGAHKYRAASHEDVLARAEREIGEEAPRMAASAKRYAEETDGLSLPVRQYLKRLSDLGNYSGKRLYEELFILKETESGFEQGSRPDREMNAFVERTGGIPTETAALARAALSDGAFVEYVPNGKNVRSGHPARATEAKFREFYQRQAERENGIYKVRARLQNPLVIDAQGAAWSDVGVYAKELALEKNANLKQIAAELGLTVEDSGSFLSKKRSLRGPTRSWSQYAKSREYDGVIFKNLYDPGTDVENDANGVSDVYIVFDPAQVKSTEAVTYDDSGRAIPLSERFDARERDIRYSADDERDGEWDEELARLPDNVREAVERMAGRDSMGFRKEDFPNLDQYLSARSSRLAAEKAERLRNKDKDEFDGTEALKKLGVRIENSAGDYSNVRQLVENDKAAKQIRKETRKAIQRLSATPKEQVFAMNISSGVFVPSDIPRGLDREKVMELADYYAAERAMSNDLIRARRSEITDRLQEKMEDLFDEKFEGEFTNRRQKKGVAPESGLALYHRTPQRSMRAIFGWERGQKINEAIFEPVYVNEQERKRFVNRMHNEVRTFTDENGRESPLTRRERAMTQLVIEGKAVEELVGKNVLKNEIIHAAENLKGGAEMKDVAREFSLSEKERDLAERYAGWLRTQEELADGSVDRAKIENAAEAYTALYDQFYSAINDFLVAHGYEPIGFIKGYAPHFQPEAESGKLERALKAIGVDLGAEVGKLPASIAGLTKEFKPNKRYNPFFQHRNGGETDIDIQKGFEKYVDYLSDILYHTDDIMRVRAASKYFRRKYAPDEISAQLEQAEELRFATPEEKELFLKTNRIVDEEASLSYEAMNEEMAKYVDGLFGDIGQTTKYGDLVTWMDDYANKLAGKQLFNDRSMEREVGRTSLNVGRRLVNAFARANVAGNLSSALNQTAQLPMIAGELGAKYVAEAIGDIAKGEVKGDFAARSDFLTEKHGIDYLTSTKGGQITEKLFWPLERMDYLISSIAVRGKYRKELAEGKSEKVALRAADRWGRDIMGSRSKGTAPLTFQSKSLLSQMVNLFQVEALNSWEHVTQDLFGEGLREAEAKLGRNEASRRLAGVIVGTLLGAFLLNRVDEELYGGTPAPFDVLGLLTGFLASGNGLSTNEQLGVWVDDVWQKMTGERLFGTDEDAGSDEFNLGAATEDTLYNISNDVPYVRNVSGVLGLGDETLPMPDIIGALSKGEKALKNADSPGDFWSEVGRQLMGLVGDTVPGGRQAEKSAQGIETLARGGSYQGFGDSKQLQYPVDIDPYTALRAALFGKNALPESRTYWAAGGVALSAAQTRLYEDLVDSGLSRKRAYEILKRFNDATADLETDKNENGKSVNGSLKEKVIKEINKLPLSRKQKNLLYLSENYSEKDLNDLPWN